MYLASPLLFHAQTSDNYRLVPSEVKSLNNVEPSSGKREALIISIDSYTEDDTWMHNIVHGNKLLEPVSPGQWRTINVPEVCSVCSGQSQPEGIGSQEPVRRGLR